MASSRQLQGTTHSAHSRRGFEAQTTLGGTEVTTKMFGAKFLDILNKGSENLVPAWHHSDKVTKVAKHFLLSYGRLLCNKPTLYKHRIAVNFIVLYTDNYTFCLVQLSSGVTRKKRKRNDTQPVMKYGTAASIDLVKKWLPILHGTPVVLEVTRPPQQPLRTSLSKISRYFRRGMPLFRAPHYS